MKKVRLTSILLSGTMAATMFGVAATAAEVDAGPGALPAVSGINGKIELGAGWSDIDDLGDDALLRGGGSLSFPVGDMFGIQADVMVTEIVDDTRIGGDLHFFTRDPNSYLLGVVGGVLTADDADAFFIGPEAELYLENFSVEAWGGYMNTDFDGAGSEDDAFGQIDLGFYATENLRFTVGASSYAGFETGRLGMEWQIGELGLPLSLTADARFGEDDFTAVSAGFKIYFGAEDKSLIRRHREDDPPNRAKDVAEGAGDGLVCIPNDTNNYCGSIFGTAQ